jgi:outer membrane protein OmpA-like peptidoglycan-associated protein
VSDRLGGAGGMDIFVTDYTDSGFTLPINVREINTSANEVFPTLFNGKLYFSSNGIKGSQGLDLYSYDFNNIQKMNFFNSAYDDYYLFFTDSFTGYFSSNKNGGFGKDDIFRFELFKTQGKIDINTIKLSDTIIFGGPRTAQLKHVVLDAKTGELIENPSRKFSIKNLESNVVTEFVYQEDSMEVLIGYLNRDSVFSIRIELSKPGYHTKIVNFDALSPTNEVLNLGNLLLFRNLNYRKPEPKKSLTLPIVYFDLDRHNIRRDAAKGLDTIVNVMKRYPESILQIKTFTDSRATPEYNMALSERRAKNIMAYLTKRGVSKKRLTYSVYGESILVNDCGDDKKCEEHLHQLNRRGEFILVN